MNAASLLSDAALVAWPHVDFSRGLSLPAADRPHWQAAPDDTTPLLYLAWGAREFGTAPVRRQRHHGWVFALVEHGCPLLLRENRSDPLPAGTVVVMGPDCAFGWHDAPERSCKLLVWMWRKPAHGPLARVGARGFVRHTLRSEEIAEVRRLHALTRGEVHRADVQSPAALAGLQTLLETHVARLGERDPQEDSIGRALHWIETNLATRQPLARLADFLCVSAATVHRLFREQLGTTVRQKITELRCQAAERMLATGDMPIKEVAYRLGYRHPHDFSRAFRNHAGVSPARHIADAAARKVRCGAHPRVSGLRTAAAA